MAEISRKSLIKVADELNDLFGLDPKISLDQDTDDLQKEIISTMKTEYKPDEDSFEPTTTTVLEALGCIKPPAAEKKGKDKEVKDEKEATTAPAEKGKGKAGKGKAEKAESATPAEKGKGKTKKERKAPAKPKAEVAKTEWGHRLGTQAADIDKAIYGAKKAVSIEKLAEQLKCTSSRIVSHIKHLTNDRKVKLTHDKEKGTVIPA